MASEKIELDVLTMQDLFGVADANLKLLERELGVSLITRDGQAVAVNGAARSVDVKENADGTVTYTYTLRDGLVWSDGQPVTAGDFAFAWQRAASPELAADYGYMFAGIEGYPDELNVKAVDDTTFEFVLRLTLYSSGFPV